MRTDITKLHAQKLELIEAAGLALSDSHSSMRSRVQDALYMHHRMDQGYPDVMHMFPDQVVYHMNGQTYRMGYSDNGKAAKLNGKQTPVKLSYTDHTTGKSTKEAASVESTDCTLTYGTEESVESTQGEETANKVEVAEGATAEVVESEGLMADLIEVGESKGFIRKDGTVLVKLIGPGQGSSAYYPEETLKQYGPKVFTKGLHMYWNHPTKTENKERPERDVRDLAAVLESDAEWMDNGPKGKGVYAVVKPFSPYKDKLNEIGAHIGASIRAWGSAVRAKVNGQNTYLMQSFEGARSVDFVTRAGAGGGLVETFESIGREAREMTVDEAATSRMEKENVMDKEQFEALLKRVDTLESSRTELVTTNSRLKDRLMISEAARIVDKGLSGVSARMADRVRLQFAAIESLPVTKDGDLDVAVLESKVADAVKAERTYLQEAAGVGAINLPGTAVATKEEKEAVEADRKRLDANRAAIFQGVN